MWFLKDLHLVLLHYPVYDRSGQVVTTAITNMDIHDLSRLAKTYGLGSFFMVTPIERQQDLLNRIVRHWVEGEGANYNPLRAEAIGLLHVAHTLEEAKQVVEARSGRVPLVVGTGARLTGENALSPRDLRKKLEKFGRPVLLLLGTGWGIAREVLETADFRLQAIEGADEYNHLSVRSAAAILLDRLACART